MTFLTLVRFLIGHRDAILRIANCRHAVWVGLIVVLSAGLAREYDGADLVVFGVMVLCARWQEQRVLIVGASMLTD